MIPMARPKLSEKQDRQATDELFSFGASDKVFMRRKESMMKMKFLVAAVVIVPLLLCACSPGSKLKEGDPEKLRVKWEGEVRKSIKDPERAEKVIALGVRLDKICNLRSELIDLLRSASLSICR
jgi:hypothetical protein